ncbi:MAG: uracil-DNA glycosylase [Mogibacterium sp.]|nr:uracil-DNA glycosylase [Mogibacterium sp.]
MKKDLIGNDWDALLADEWQKPYYQELRAFLINEYKTETVYPPASDIYNALRLTNYDDVKVVILGQDPYHEPGQAQGLAFSVPYGTQLPPSLVNILKELESDLGIHYERDNGTSGDNRINDGDNDGNNDAATGILVPWARQGVLLLNTVLTVRAHRAASHRGRGWEQFTDRVIELLAEREKPMAFVLWGAHAQAKKGIIVDAQHAGGKEQRHLIIEAPHPSPLSAYRGFFGGCYFSRCNYFLTDNGMEPVDWNL